MRNFIPINELRVGLDFIGEIIFVGRLALKDYRIYFEYDQDFLGRGLEISPLKLPLTPGLHTFEYRPFEGLPGVFNDSLPEGWGRLLFDRYLRSQNMMSEDFSPLDRLAHIGVRGLGALVYEPDNNKLGDGQNEIDLDELSQSTQEILDGESSEVLKELIDLNGSSAGARPKALIGLNKTKDHIVSGTFSLQDDYEHWLVKFANSSDGVDAGAIEYVYALMAKQAGVEM